MAVAPTQPAQDSEKPVPASRLEFIEGMRGVAAFYVVLQHTVTMVDPYMKLRRPENAGSWLALATGWMNYAHFAVAAFIVISGFCLQMALFRSGAGRLQNLKRFSKRRCLRILPPYYACLALSIGVVLTVTMGQKGMPWSQYLPLTRENVLAHVFMIHNWSPEWMYKINGVLWSIAVEFQLYFLFPLLVWLVWRVGRIAVLFACFAVAGAALFAFPQAHKLYIWYLPLFASGLVAAHAVFAKEENPAAPSHKIGWILVGTVACFGLGLYACSQTKVLWIRDIPFGLGTAGLLMLGCLNSMGLVARCFSLKFLVWLGAFSYSLYLVHHPIMQVLYVYRPRVFSTNSQQFLYLWLIALPVILLACWAFYWIFERPFLKQKSKS